VLVNCRALVANDSGAMHLAAALGVPVVALFGPTDERQTSPRGEVRRRRDQGTVGQRPDAATRPDHVVLTHDVWCRPCKLRTCPIDHRCMRRIPPSAVVDAARQMV
jgi:heptosyltransferase-2